MFSPSLAACLCPWLMAEVHFEQQRQPRPLPAPFHKNLVTLCSCSKKEKKNLLMEIQHKPKQGLCICNCMRGLGFYNLLLLFSCFSSGSVVWVVTLCETHDQSLV